jgi:Ca2+-binding RTX toxin-like protein
MNDDLFKAILSMDAYNRGYNARINFGTNLSSDPDSSGSFSIGNATFLNDSGKLLGAKTAGFYAIAYNYKDETIISFRGTDSAWDIKDWLGAVSEYFSIQSGLASLFYNSMTSDPGSKNISLTGHSLGGGLAGMVGADNLKKAVLFDYMPFEPAILASSLINPIKSAISLLYSSYNIESYSLNGEALEYFRMLNLTQSKGYDLGADVNLGASQKHSISLLAIRMFADSIGEDWKAAAKYFLPQLFNEEIATAVGVASLKGPGASCNSDVMRDMIAYSALEKGIDGKGLIFGDTAIRAMYDDANEFGQVLAQANVSEFFSLHGDEISEVFVQFASQLAMGKIVDTEHDAAKNGVISLNPDATFTINFDDSLWSLGRTETQENIIGRYDLFKSVLPDTAIAQNLYLNSAFINNIGSITIAETETSLTTTTTAVQGDDQMDMFIASDANDFITGSAGNDLIIGDSGNDILYGSNGNDILFGGLYDPTDIVDYDKLEEGITITVSDNTVTKSNGIGTDTLYEIDKIIGTPFADTFSGSLGSLGGNYFIGNGGNDTFNLGSGVNTVEISSASGAQNITINGYHSLDKISIDGTILSNFTQDAFGIYRQGSLELQSRDSNGVTVKMAGGSTVRINGFTSIISSGSPHTVNGTTEKVDDAHANVHFTADTAGAIIAGPATAEITNYYHVYHSDGSVETVPYEAWVPATNIIHASSEDISQDAITNIQNLEASGNITLTAAQFDGFSKISGSGILTVAGGGSVSLAGKPLGSGSSFDLDAIGWSGTTLIGNDQDGQSLWASAFGNDTLIAGNGNNDILWAGGGDCVLTGGNGNDKLYMGTGESVYHGGTGNDNFIYQYLPAAGTVINGDSGSNAISFFTSADLRNLQISNIQTLNLTGNDVCISAEQWGYFSTITTNYGATITAIGSGIFSLADKTTSGLLHLYANGDDDTTLIGNGVDGQNLRKKGNGNSTLINGEGNNHRLIVEGCYDGTITLTNGNGNNSYLEVNSNGSVDATLSNGNGDFNQLIT